MIQLIVMVTLAVAFIFWLSIVKLSYCQHDWEYLGEWGITYQQKKCRKCGKLKIVDQ